MDKEERFKLVSAMEFIVRHVNDEELLDPWFMCGVADGDIPYGEKCEYEWYIDDDDEFEDLMRLFLRTMHNAYIDGGLFCDGCCSD